VKGIIVTKMPDARWGEPRIARAIGTDADPWGVLAVLRETPWEPLIREVSHASFDQALRGHATPLMRELGPPPKALVRRLPVSYATCRDRTSCVNATPKCVPGSAMPECWTGSGLPFGPATEVTSYIARLWKEDVPVVVVVSEG
jgi:hypothetical protein